ncbi:hypothetical protein ONS95_011848 [Cadophora gregata]|uniref:uncharacterized protein n=1 Tax=Cadophora gregata TaxID=51156 RepID=UPI0026DD2F3F|nr:uncharacterized protein ONS95_011848 [Cadophora gregata]KAK0117508.1 hypothetical protein ONS95_011848 [Cadophora gregata]
MSDPLPQQQTFVRPAPLGEAWHLSYNIPNPNANGSGLSITGRGQVEVYVYPGATNFQLVNTGEIVLRPLSPRQPDVPVREWPTVPPQGSVQHVAVTNRWSRFSVSNSDSAMPTRPARPARRAAFTVSFEPEDDTENSNQNVPASEVSVEGPTTGGSLSYRQFLARIAAAEQNAASSATTRRHGRPEIPRQHETRLPFVVDTGRLRLGRPLGLAQERGEGFIRLHDSGINIRDGGTSNSGRMNRSSSTPQATVSQRTEDNNLNDTDGPDKVADLSLDHDSRDMATANPGYDRQPLIRQRTHSTLENTHVEIEAREEYPQSLQ